MWTGHEHGRMSQEGERDDAMTPADGDPPDRPAVVERDAVANAFVDATPRTLPEVVDDIGLECERTRDALDALVAADDLATKRLTAGDATVRAWYLPATAHVERLASGTPDAERADAVEDAIATMDVPGVSEMMQDWRRDAIRGAWEYVAEHGAATDDAIVDAVYAAHSAGYDDRGSWWECVRPRLASLPGVTPPSEGDDDVWTYVPV